MHERVGAVFCVGELECEIPHVALQPCHSVFPGVPLLQTRLVYGDAQRGKKSSVAQKKSWKSYREEVKEMQEVVWLEKSLGEIWVLPKWHREWCHFFIFRRDKCMKYPATSVLVCRPEER